MNLYPGKTTNKYTYLAHRALPPIFRRHNSPAESVVQVTMDRFCAMFTLEVDAHNHSSPSSRVSKVAQMSLYAVARENWGCVHRLYGRLCGKILVGGHTRVRSRA